MNVRDLIAAAARRLGGGDSRLDAELLLAHALAVSRTKLYAFPEHEPETSQLETFERLVSAREHGEPIAYLIGRREFWSLDLAVSPAVLIPRPETERLVELALAHLPRDADLRVADLGTGSGAIALAIARERPRAHVIATDASAAALEVARENAMRLDLSNVTFSQGDWCDALGDGTFDVIVSNPPYIAAADPHLETGDLRSEPRAALVSGPDGLDAVRRIVADAVIHLNNDGWLLLEHGWDQAARVRALLETRGYADVATEHDGAGHERMTLGRKRR